MPSAMNSTGIRYCSALSYANIMMSTASCTGRGCVGQQVVVTVAAALDSLEVVALGSLNVAEAGAAAHYVQDNAGEALHLRSRRYLPASGIYRGWRRK